MHTRTQRKQTIKFVRNVEGNRYHCRHANHMNDNGFKRTKYVDIINSVRFALVRKEVSGGNGK